MNIKDIAKLAGVSVSTVSKVMNQKDSSISPETRKKVLQIAKEYNYIPYSSFLPATKKTFLIGVLFRSSTSIQKTLNGILSVARFHGYQIILADSNQSSTEERKAISRFCKNKIDAVLWELVDEKSLSFSSDLMQAQIPYFIFNSNVSGSENIDYLPLGYHATKSCIEYRHQNIACLLQPGTRTDAFIKGYKQCLFENRIAFREDFIFDTTAFTALFEKIGNRSITAVVCSHYAAAVELYARSASYHYQIPLDFSLISLKDDIRSDLQIPIISSYSISRFDYGKFLGEKIIHHIENSVFPVQKFQSTFELSNTNTIHFPYFMQTKKITAVGSTNIDIYLKLPQLPTSGKAVLTSQTSVYAGGKAVNEAIGAAKLGHRVSIIGAVGTNADADIIYDALRQHSVDTDGMKRVADLETGKAYIFVEPKGDSMITILSGANEALSPDDLYAKEKLFENTAYALINTEIPMKTVEIACRLTKKYGGKSILKPSSRNYLSPALFDLIDILILNISELNDICPEGTSLEEKAKVLHQKGIRIIIITLGAKGCYFFSDQHAEYFSAKDFPSIDNTGAGDAFISAFASYLLYGYSPVKAVQIAGYAAGFCISREGVAPSLVDKNTLESYIYQREPHLLEK